VSRRHFRCLNARSSPSMSLTFIAGRSSRLPAKKRQIVVALRPLARASSPCVIPPSSSIASRRRSGDMPAGVRRTGAYGSASGAPTAKAKAVELELRRKLAELDERYACRLDLTPLALVRTDCPALAVRCHVLRRSAGRTIPVFWNALTKELEPLCCSRCGVSTFTLAFSDDTLAACCASCQ